MTDRTPSNRTIGIVAAAVAGLVALNTAWVDRPVPAPPTPEAPAATWTPRCATVAAGVADAKRGLAPVELRDYRALGRDLDAIAKGPRAGRRDRALNATASFLALDAEERRSFVAAAPAVLDRIGAAARERARVTRELGKVVGRVSERALETAIVTAGLRYERDLQAALKGFDPYLTDSKRHRLFRLRLTTWAERLATFA